MQMTLRNFQSPLRLLVSVALVLSLIGGSFTPVAADTVSTRNIALGALALAVGIVLYNNYEHKVATANSVVGYTRDGGVLYGDGRIVYPNNITAYATNNGTQVCTFNGAGVPCRSTHLSGYFRRGYKPPCWPPGHCKDYWKKHHKDHGNGNDQGSDH
jgi:hypothetical protein